VFQDSATTVPEGKEIMSISVSKVADDEVYYLTVNGASEVMSAEKAFMLVDTLLGLLGEDSYIGRGINAVPGSGTVQ
jgi:hypothetical protein